MLAPPEAESPSTDGAPVAEANADAIELLMKAGVEDNSGVMSGRCLLFQAPGRPDADAYVAGLEAPSADHGAWEIYELVPNHAPEFVKQWFGGKFAKAHGS